MQIDTQMQTYDLRAVGDAARRIEAMGFDALWTFESNHDPFLSLGVVAAVSRQLQIGTNISVAFGRSPFAMAQTSWDLQQSSGGRFHLGLGTQVRAHVERRFSMPFEHPARRITDYVRCLRAIWDTFQHDRKPDYQGEFYQFRLINAFFNPGPIENPEIPIYLAGVGPRMCRAAGEVADGFHVHPMHSAGYLRDVVRPALQQGAATRGLGAADLVIYAPVFTISGDTPEERTRREAEVRRQISFYASTPSYRPVLEYHGLDKLGKRLSEMARRGEWKDMPALIPDSLVDEVAVAAATPRELPERLASRYRGLVDRLSLYFAIPEGDPDAKWKRFVEDFHRAAS